MEIKLNYEYVKREIDKLIEPQDKLERAIELLAEYKGAKKVFNSNIINTLAGRTESASSLKIKSYLESVIDSYKKVLDKPEQDKTYTVESLAKLLDISTSTVYKLVETGKIKYNKPSGKKIYFKQSYVDEYLSNEESTTEVEIKREAMKHMFTYKKKNKYPGKKKHATETPNENFSLF